MWHKDDVFKLPYVDIIDGSPYAVPRALFAIAAALQGARGGVDIPDSDIEAIKSRVEAYYSRMRDEFNDESIVVPWLKGDAAEASDSASIVVAEAASATALEPEPAPAVEPVVESVDEAAPEAAPVTAPEPAPVAAPAPESAPEPEATSVIAPVTAHGSEAAHEPEHAPVTVHAPVSPSGKSTPIRIDFTGRILESLTSNDFPGNRWRVALIQAGESQNRTIYPMSVLRRAIPLFEGAVCFADNHGGPNGKAIRDIVGWFSNVTAEESPMFQGITADFDILDSQGWFKDMIAEAWSRGKRNLVGFSILGDGAKRFIKMPDGHIAREVTSIDSLVSVDAVSRPAAGGKFLYPISEDIDTMDIQNLTREELQALRPDLFESVEQTEAEATPAPTQPDPAIVTEITSLRETLSALQESNRRMQQQAYLDSSLKESGLPIVFQGKLRKRFESLTFTAEELQEAIADEKAALSEVVPPDLPAFSRIRVGLDSRDKIDAAMDGMFQGRDVLVEGGKIPRFHNLRDAYARLKGISIFDVRAQNVINEMAQPFDSGLRESISSTDWASVFGASMTRQMLAEYRTKDYEEWRKVATWQVLDNMKLQERVRIGGYGLLSTVTEGDDYGALSSPTDQKQTYTPTLKGGLETITFQAIANDDMGAIRLVPRNLALAAKVTLYHAVFDILPTNAAMGYDSTALFHANHANLGTSALSDSTLEAAKAAMRAQKVPTGTTDVAFLDNEPKTIIVPSALRRTAWDLINNEVMVLSSNYNATMKNPHYQTLEMIEVRHWTDTNNWYLAADPRAVPVIEVGFYGSEEPELFNEAANTGKNFTADSVRFKVRHIWGVVALDHRGLYGAIVS